PELAAYRNPGAALGRRLPMADVSFQPVRFADLPAWAVDDHRAALHAFLKSCQSLTSSGEVGVSLGRLCSEALSVGPTAADARHFFESRFTPHRVVHARSHGLLTGYYEPVLEGSRRRHGPYQVPVYRGTSDPG